jgi:cytochrome c-type biogenesis protein CcmH/NrfG
VQALELMMRTMPAEPPATCKTPSESVRQQARSQVNTGDDARMARDNVGAVRAYLAGIAMDPCNGFAWLGLGQAAIDLQRADLAIRALRPATRLMPTHYGAWTKLGQQYEAMGQRDSAVEAYWRALELQPGLPEPKAGLGRLGAGEKPAAAPSKQADTTPNFGEEEDEW